MFGEQNGNRGHLTRSYYEEILEGKISGKSIIHKFGRNSAVSDDIVPISLGGNYRKPTAAVSLEAVSTHIGDTALGLGARSLFIEGLDSNYKLQTEVVALDGLTAVQLTKQYIRIFRYFVYESGTYATQTSPSHLGDLILRVTGGGEQWGIINDVTTFARGQSQIGAYTVPSGKHAYIMSIKIHSEATKSANVLFFKREGADIVTAPFSPMRLVFEFDGVENDSDFKPYALMGIYPEKTDIGFVGRLQAGSGIISVDFEILLIDNE